ncbi:MAG: septum formation initiator [Proteobacteria bacterium SG_bin5]|nr:septum formation initiator family protein [Sphingomonas sp.]OQW43260.1 MAG: septum formation initiator [Proteobacteria bacterium SG_bin5]
MTSSPRLAAILRRAGAPALALGVIAFFAGYALVGANGVFAYGDYKRQLVKREKILKLLEHRRMVLQNRVALLDPRHANPDMVDEQVRRQLNLAHPDEVIVPLR